MFINVKANLRFIVTQVERKKMKTLQNTQMIHLETQIEVEMLSTISI